MEAAARIAEPVLARRELPEVTCGPGHDVVVELEDDAPKGLLVCCNVKLAPIINNSTHILRTERILTKTLALEPVAWSA